MYQQTKNCAGDEDDGEEERLGVPAADCESCCQDGDQQQDERPGNEIHVSTMTIQATPNRSVHMPKAGEKKVLSSGMFTLPPSHRLLKILFASGSVATARVRAMPFEYWVSPG